MRRGLGGKECGDSRTACTAHASSCLQLQSGHLPRMCSLGASACRARVCMHVVCTRTPPTTHPIHVPKHATHSKMPNLPPSPMLWLYLYLSLRPCSSLALIASLLLQALKHKLHGMQWRGALAPFAAATVAVGGQAEMYGAVAKALDVRDACRHTFESILAGMQAPCVTIKQACTHVMCQ